MAEQIKTFLVSTADAAFQYNDQLAFTATANLNSSLEVSMQEQNVNGGKGNQLLYSFKYGRELSCTLEATDWQLPFIAAQVGSSITEGLTDVYKLNECVDIVEGIGTLASVPVSDKVAVTIDGGAIIEVEPEGSTIDLTANGITSGTVLATYRFNTMAKSIVIDASTSPLVGTLVLDADKHNNKVGKVGTVQIEIPSYQLSGNFTISFTPDGVTSTNIDGKALAVNGDKCSDGSAVYGYIKEFDFTNSAISVNMIAATPAVINLAKEEEVTLSVIGIKGGMYANVQLNNADCQFTSKESGTATVDTDGKVKGVEAGTTTISVKYNGLEDVVEVTVTD